MKYHISSRKFLDGNQEGILLNAYKKEGFCCPSMGRKKREILLALLILILICLSIATVALVVIFYSQGDFSVERRATDAVKLSAVGSVPAASNVVGPDSDDGTNSIHATNDKRFDLEEEPEEINEISHGDDYSLKMNSSTSSPDEQSTTEAVRIFTSKRTFYEAAVLPHLKSLKSGLSKNSNAIANGWNLSGSGSTPKPDVPVNAKVPSSTNDALKEIPAPELAPNHEANRSEAIDVLVTGNLHPNSQFVSNGNIIESNSIPFWSMEDFENVDYLQEDFRIQEGNNQSDNFKTHNIKDLHLLRGHGSHPQDDNLNFEIIKIKGSSKAQSASNDSQLELKDAVPISNVDLHVGAGKNLSSGADDKTEAYGPTVLNISDSVPNDSQPVNSSGGSATSSRVVDERPVSASPLLENLWHFSKLDSIFNSIPAHDRNHFVDDAGQSGKESKFAVITSSPDLTNFVRIPEDVLNFDLGNISRAWNANRSEQERTGENAVPAFSDDGTSYEASALDGLFSPEIASLLTSRLRPQTSSSNKKQRSEVYRLIRRPLNIEPRFLSAVQANRKNASRIIPDWEHNNGRLSEYGETPQVTILDVFPDCLSVNKEFCNDYFPYSFVHPNDIKSDQVSNLFSKAFYHFKEMADSECYPKVKALICKLLQPLCNLRTQGSLPPCRQFCQSAVHGCHSFIEKMTGVSDIFDCEQYPMSDDPEVCFMPFVGNSCDDGNEYRCLNGSCLSEDRWCDGIFDCSRGEDEANCAECKGSFRCHSGGFCIPAEWQCDGIRNCFDGSDEILCHETIK